MRATRNRWAQAYGAPGWHLLLMVASLLAAAFVVRTVGLEALWDPEVWWQSIVIWFAGAVVLHDLVLFPAYALLDRVLRAGLRSDTGKRDAALVNYVRLPSLAAGFTFLLFFPGILKRGADTYEHATGLDQDPFLIRWLLLAAAGYLVSALWYLLARGRRVSREAVPSQSPRAPGPGAPPR